MYVSSWLKCHEPAAFACALLNSQPLGFYSTSAITQDARRHGVELRPVDVQVSDVDSKLERHPGKLECHPGPRNIIRGQAPAGAQFDPRFAWAWDSSRA